MTSLPNAPIIYAIYVYRKDNECRGIYIGSSKNGARRRYGHLSLLRRGKHDNKRLQSLWNKYGETSFYFEVVEDISDNNILIKREQFWIDTLVEQQVGKKLLNLSLIAGRPIRPKGYHHASETKKKISLGNKGKKVSDVTRAKTSASGKIRFSDPKEREKLSKSHRGKRHTKEARQNMSLSQRARSLRNPLSGITWSKTKKKHLVRVTINGVLKHVAYCASIEEAVEKRDATLKSVRIT
jgi:group I intron endonuclease